MRRFSLPRCGMPKMIDDTPAAEYCQSGAPSVKKSIHLAAHENKESRAGSIDSPPSRPYCRVRNIRHGERIGSKAYSFKIRKLELKEIVKDLTSGQKSVNMSFLLHFGCRKCLGVIR